MSPNALPPAPLPFGRDGRRLPLPAKTGRHPLETLAERKRRLQALTHLQREQLAAQWEQLEPTGMRVDAGLARVDAGVARLQRLRSHPVIMALLALSAARFMRGRSRRGLMATLRFGLGLVTRAATLASVWRALRGR
ncbi:MAG: hypothetical protein AB7L76_07925 [Burkholderiaceae bacterium]